SAVAEVVVSLSVTLFLFSNIRVVAGWDLDRMLVLTGTYQFVSGVVFLLFDANMGKLSEYVNKGELDYVLLKPIDSQFYVSTRFLTLHQVPAIVVAAVILAVGWARLGLTPAPLELAGYLVLMASAVVAFYAIWFGTV